MRSSLIPAAVLAGLFASSSAMGAVNALVDPGFEGTLTFDGPPFVGSWEGFSAGGTSSSVLSTSNPHSGLQNLQLDMGGTPNVFAGAFQDVDVVSGAMLTYTGWHMGSYAGDHGIEIRIEWRDSVNNVEISRTPNFTPTIGTSYEMFTLQGTAPVGADRARIIYAVQSFGGAVNGSVSVDDLSVTGIPEPGAALLLGLGGLGFAVRRRR